MKRLAGMNWAVALNIKYRMLDMKNNFFILNFEQLNEIKSTILSSRFTVNIISCTNIYWIFFKRQRSIEYLG